MCVITTFHMLKALHNQAWIFQRVFTLTRECYSLLLLLLRLPFNWLWCDIRSDYLGLRLDWLGKSIDIQHISTIYLMEVESLINNFLLFLLLKFFVCFLILVHVRPVKGRLPIGRGVKVPAILSFTFLIEPTILWLNFGFIVGLHALLLVDGLCLSE